MYKILTLSSSSEWKYYFFLLPEDRQDIYYTPEYYELYEKNGDGKAQCFVFEKDDEIALYPFLINSVNSLGYNLGKQYYDIQGAYGYNGVASSSDNKAFIEAFSSAFQEYSQETNIISEFTRFNPIIKNHFFSRFLEIIYDRDNVFVNLNLDDFEKESYKYSTQKNIKKAKRNLLSCVAFKGTEVNKSTLLDFIDIYYLTLDRNIAEKYYYFSLNFFESIFSNLAKNCTLYFVSYQGKYISTELVLHGKKIAYSFLGGTLSENFDLRPNDLLKDYIIKDLKYKELKIFCLGGGSDGVLKYKMTFARNGVIPFYIGKKVYNQVIYDEVINQWELKFPEKKVQFNNRILKYRY